MKEIVAYMTCNLCGKQEEIYCPNDSIDWPYTNKNWLPIDKDTDYCPACKKKLHSGLKQIIAVPSHIMGEGTAYVMKGGSHEKKSVA